MDTKTVHTFCRYCLASCGIEVTVEGNRVTKISADKQNPHTWQDFCAKGRTANQLVEHPRRILNPMRRVGDTYVEATWDEAITDIAARMNALAPESYGANRNLLIDGGPVDPLSQTSALSSSYVGVERVG
jgi:formate dehydrogenase